MRSILNPDRVSPDYINESFSSLTDLELIRLIGNRDRDAFTALYQRQHSGVFNYLIRLIHEPAVAEELLQEVFLTLWRTAAAFRSEAQVKTWIYRIAHNQAVDWLRKKRPQTLELVDLIPSGEDSPEDISLLTWRTEEIRQALDELPPQQRAVVELYFVNDLTQKEIAAVVGCPVGTVKSRLRFALRNLKWELSRRGLSGD